MKRANISNNVIRRLPRYLRKLDDLAYNGVDRISSGELGTQMGLTASQIRQDFSCFGEFGQQGYGYTVSVLRDEIASILGLKHGFSVILVGAGNLGHALIKNFSFDNYGFKFLSAFDIRQELVGTRPDGVTIYDIADLPSFLRENRVDIAILTVPRRNAHATAQMLYDCGIRAIWNFTNIDLHIHEDDLLIEDIHFSDSLLSLSYFLSESGDKADER